jgi:hypothetical protein
MANCPPAAALAASLQNVAETRDIVGRRLARRNPNVLALSGERKRNLPSWRIGKLRGRLAFRPTRAGGPIVLYPYYYLVGILAQSKHDAGEDVKPI